VVQHLDIQQPAGLDDGFGDGDVIGIYMENKFDTSFIYLYSEIKGWYPYEYRKK
jgi:hypothetical protein